MSAAKEKKFNNGVEWRIDYTDSMRRPSILAWPIEAPTDDIRVEPYGAETPDDQAPGHKEEQPQEARNDTHEQRSHVVSLSTSRVVPMRAVRWTHGISGIHLTAQNTAGTPH
jgi:hypothetical protein